MHRNWIFALTVSVVALGAFCAVTQAGDDPPAAGGDTAKAAEQKAAEPTGKDWSEHTGDLPFIVGYEKGMQEVGFTGRPPMYFFTATWWGYCKKLAGSAFKDADVIKALSGFTPILVDGDVEKDVCKKYGVKGYPGTVFADAKGESAGPTIVGAVPVKDFLSKAQDFAKKIKPGKPSKDYATLMAAGKALETAQAKNKIADALAAIAKIEKVNHPGKVLDDALAARKTLLEAGQMRFDAAKAAADGDGKDGDGKDGADKDGAVKELKKIATEYKGTDLGTDAAALVKELTAPPPDAK